MAFDAYIKMSGIEGEATRAGFEKAMEIYSFSWGASNPSSIGTGSTGHGSGKVSVSSFNIMKKSETASAKLFQHCCTAAPIASVSVHLLKSGGEEAVEFLKYTFTDCVIESLQWSGSAGGDDTPTESLSIAFAKVEIEYKQQGTKDAKGANKGLAAWDLTKASGK